MLVGRRAEELAESSRARLSNAAQRSVPGEMVVCVSLVQATAMTATCETLAKNLRPTFQGQSRSISDDRCCGDRSGVVLSHMPPDAASISPVTHRASSDARNTATGAMSSGCPIRPNGVCCNICFSKSLPKIPADRVPSVSTSPGLMAFTLILRGPSSFANTRVIASMALLEAMYTDVPGGGLRVTVVLKLMMLPPSG